MHQILVTAKKVLQYRSQLSPNVDPTDATTATAASVTGHRPPLFRCNVRIRLSSGGWKALWRRRDFKHHYGTAATLSSLSRLLFVLLVFRDEQHHPAALRRHHFNLLKPRVDVSTKPGAVQPVRGEQIAVRISVRLRARP